MCDDNGRRAALAAAHAGAHGLSPGVGAGGRRQPLGQRGPAHRVGHERPQQGLRREGRGRSTTCRPSTPTSWPRRQRRGDELIILDTRTPEEYRRFCIPGGRSAPGGELALRIHDIVRERPNATVVVNCAGRTRSIIGARVLQRMELPERRQPAQRDVGLAAGRPRARARRRPRRAAGAVGRRAAPPPRPSPPGVAAEDGVRMLTVAELQKLMARATDETVYLIDVRTREEYAAGHIPGFGVVPRRPGRAARRRHGGGAHRHDRLLLRRSRARVTDGLLVPADGLPQRLRRRRRHDGVEGGGASRWPRARTSRRSRWWPKPAHACVRSRRPRWRRALASARPPRRALRGAERPVRRRPRARRALAVRAAGSSSASPSVAADATAPIVVTDEDGHDAVLAAATLMELGYRDVAALAGGIEAWRKEGRPLE